MNFNKQLRKQNRKAKFYAFVEHQTKRNLKALIVLLVMLCGIIAMDTEVKKMAIETFPAYAETVKSEPLKELTNKEIVWKIMTEEYGLSFDEAINGMSIVKCESNFNPYAINKNKDGSYDLGEWQINDRIHGKSINRADSFDVYKSTRYAMELYKKHSWNVWVCWKNLK